MSAPVHPPLPDQAARDQFRSGLEQNFSVIAPAGVGKTTAIVERIASLAKRVEVDGQNALSCLVVVTYTIKAAAEMKERARQRLAESGPGAVEGLAAFNSAFFGTIHGFCLELLRRWGHVLGLPPTLQLVEDEQALWIEFLSAQDDLLGSLPEPLRRELPRYVDIRELAGLARRLPSHGTPPVLPTGPFPQPDLTALLSYKAKATRSIPVVERNQRALRQWLAAYEDGEVWVGLPTLKGGGKEFEALCEAAFAPLRNWLAIMTGAAAASLAERFRVFRLERGQVLFEDQVSLACELMAHPAAGRHIREQGWRVILDEAQDTDPAQFDVLLAVAQSPDDEGDWRAGHLPPPGRFCMVGDPQQSIYSDRADISTYLAAHEALVSHRGGQEATFTVTMRCDEAVVDWVNASAPAALNGMAGQVSLVPLQARPAAGVGAAEVLKLAPDEPIDPRKEAYAVRAEAQKLAEWLSERSPADFGVADWSEIALLCPRKKSRLEVLAQAMESAGLPVQNHGRSDKRGEEPAFAWLSGLAIVMAEPENAFELAGVLREVFGLSDGAIAEYVDLLGTEGPRHPLNLATLPRVNGPVAGALKELYRVRLEVLGLPLRSGFDYLLNSLSLKARLGSLPDVTTEPLGELAALAASAEEAGSGWPEFARTLRCACTGVSGEADPEPGKFQLLTCQKAKGLEWPVVIVPFFFSSIKWPNPTYPLALDSEDGIWTISLDSDHDVADAKSYRDRRLRQSLERLLYVTLTRPRQRLILIDDEAFFPKGSSSFAECLRLRDGEENRKAWQELPEWTVAPAEVERTQVQSAIKSPAPPAKEDVVLEAKPAYIRRVLPSSLAKHETGHVLERTERDRMSEPEYPEIARGGTGGTGYGNWWHGAMETMPWQSDREAWRLYLEKNLETCPDPERGQREITLFLQSELAVLLSSARIVRTELSMLWRAGETEAYDGSIDLLAQLPDKQWLLLDWKTDRVGSNPEQELLKAYGPQLNAYRESIIDIIGSNLKSALYSTRCGRIASLE